MGVIKNLPKYNTDLGKTNMVLLGSPSLSFSAYWFKPSSTSSKNVCLQKFNVLSSNTNNRALHICNAYNNNSLQARNQVGVKIRFGSNHLTSLGPYWVLLASKTLLFALGNNTNKLVCILSLWERIRVQTTCKSQTLVSARSPARGTVCACLHKPTPNSTNKSVVTPRVKIVKTTRHPKRFVN